MNCDLLSEIIGFQCYPLGQNKDVLMVGTPFAFSDGDDIPIFVETFQNKIRFFDDGAFLWQMKGRGINPNGHLINHLKNSVEELGVTFNLGEFEIWADKKNAKAAFSQFLSAALRISEIEKQKVDFKTEESSLLEEVGTLLRTWKQSTSFQENVEYIGMTGKKYKIEFVDDKYAYVIALPHPTSVNAVLSKVLDIQNRSGNTNFKPYVVLEDRIDKGAAREAMILATLCTVMTVTNLQKNALRASNHSVKH